MQAILAVIAPGDRRASRTCKMEPRTRPVYEGGPMSQPQRNAVMLIAPDNFRDEEYFKPKALLEEAGCSVTTASQSTAACTGMLGARVQPDIALVQAVSMARNDLWDAAVFVGGSGAEVYFNDGDAQALAREVAGRGCVVGAICIAPAILAHTGLLQGILVTSFPSVREILEDAGATWTGEQVEHALNLVADGSVTVTANGPEAAEAFGAALVKALGL